MKKQYFSPTATAEAVSIQHFLQTESITDINGDSGYNGGGHGGGRAPRRGRDYFEDDYFEEERPEQEDTSWGSLW